MSPVPPPVRSNSLEDNDNTLEDYLFVLIMNKKSVHDALHKVYDVMLYERDNPSKAIFWLADEDKLVLSKALFGKNFEEIKEIKEYIRVYISGRIDLLRTIALREKGFIFNIIMVTIENIVNVDDKLAMQFVMNDRKQEIETLLISYVVTILRDFREQFAETLARYQDRMERYSGMNSSRIVDPNPSDDDLKPEIRELIGQCNNLSEDMIIKYQNDAEIEGMVNIFIKQMETIYMKRR